VVCPVPGAGEMETFTFVATTSMQTFDDLRLPFELFKAPIAHAVIDADGDCAHCNCAAALRFHELCYSCFRNGFSDAAIDTELGMVAQELAEMGMTHGLPLSNPSEYEDYGTTAHPVDPKFPDETWFHIHVPSKWLRELLRTPRYHTWQGERWLFCCHHPMVFRGSIPAELLDKSQSGIVIQMSRFLADPRWQDTVRAGRSSHTYYAFSCGDCGRLRYHDDCD
jgi:hypothetical protein